MIFKHGRLQSFSFPYNIIDYLWGIFPATAALCLVLALWQWVHNQMGSIIMPDPQSVFLRVWDILTSFENEALWHTLWRACIAISMAILTGSLFGFLAGSSRTLTLLLRPINTLLLGIPPIIWVVLAIFWFDMGSFSIMFSVWIVVLPMVFSAAQMSFLSVPSSLIEMLKVYRISLYRQIISLYIPHILRQMLPALIVAVGSGLKITVMAELLGGNDGIGAAIGSARSMLETVDVMAYVVIILSIIMGIEYGILEPIRRVILKGEFYVKAE